MSEDKDRKVVGKRRTSSERHLNDSAVYPNTITGKVCLAPAKVSYAGDSRSKTNKLTNIRH